MQGTHFLFSLVTWPAAQRPLDAAARTAQQESPCDCSRRLAVHRVTIFLHDVLSEDTALENL